MAFESVGVSVPVGDVVLLLLLVESLWLLSTTLGQAFNFFHVDELAVGVNVVSDVL